MAVQARCSQLMAWVPTSAEGDGHGRSNKLQRGEGIAGEEGGHRRSEKGCPAQRRVGLSATALGIPSLTCAGFATDFVSVGAVQNWASYAASWRRKFRGREGWAM